MNYSLLKFTFPDFDKKESQPQPQSPPPPPPVETFEEDNNSQYLPAYNNNVFEFMDNNTSPSPVSPHNACVGHALSCITCRDAMMRRMSFSDRNRDIIDTLPYILIFIILIIVYKMI
jgi:hypothetical protein